MTFSIEQLSFQENGLIPAVVQDFHTGDVLMIAYMNAEALEKTIDTGEAWFFSRSRQELWHKGATSGNRQLVKSIAKDCDGDSLLVQVEPLGPACHTGNNTCFYRTEWETEAPNRNAVRNVVEVIRKRQANPLEGSYTNYLFEEGIDKVLKKVGEEASEVIIAAKNEDPEELTWEIADLVFHTLVLMQQSNVTINDINEELVKRHIAKTEAKQ